MLESSTQDRAEWLAGRKQFTRWALTPQGITACPNFPGCPEGFEQVSPLLTTIMRSMRVGDAAWQADRRDRKHFGLGN